MRRCIVCGTSLPKQELIRIVTGEDGVVVVDPTGRKNGRGAYICRNAECLKKAIRNKGIERALGVTLSDEIYAQLLSEMPADGE